MANTGAAPAGHLQCVVLNRLLTSLALVSLLLALTTLAVWWRADHGHSDTFHLGANSATQTQLYTAPDSVIVDVKQRQPSGEIGERMDKYPLRRVLGFCLFLPGLWVAVRVRRRLVPRVPGSQLPAMRSLR
jgi:hypothetical protein